MKFTIAYRTAGKVLIIVSFICILTKTATIIIINNEEEIKARRMGKDEPINKPIPANNCKIAI